MPPVIQAVTYLVPARYFIVILRGIYLIGTGMRDLWPQTLFLPTLRGVGERARVEAVRQEGGVSAPAGA